jgi:hypothetical protein
VDAEASRLPGAWRAPDIVVVADAERRTPDGLAAAITARGSSGIVGIVFSVTVRPAKHF